MPSERTYRLAGLTVRSAFPLPELRPAASRRAQWRIELDGRPASGGQAWFHRWRANGRAWLTFARVSDGYLLRFPRLADFVVSGGREERIACRPSAHLPAATLRHLLLDQVWPLALSRTGRLVLHGSAVHVPGAGAVAFVGAAGRGKSTLAAALARDGCTVVTDDCLVIDDQDDEVAVLPGYPGMRLWPDAAAALGLARGLRLAHYTSKRRIDPGVPFRRQASRLRVICLLEPLARAGQSVRVARCPAREALMALLRCAYVLDVDDRRRLAQQFEQLARLVARVPVVRLTLARDAQALDLSARAVRASLADLLE